MKNLIILTIISFCLRFFLLGSIPQGFSNDEASLGYNAYSILKTGKDEFGSFLPLAFKAFGEYKAPLYIYASLPFIAFFDLNEFSVRFPSAFFGFLTIIFFYFLVKKLFKDEKVAFSAALILSISPWHLQFTRIAYEGSLTLFLIVAAVFFFVRGVKEKRYLFISVFFFAASFYSHYSVRVFTPLYVFVLIMVLKKQLIRIRRHLLLSILLGLIILLPLLPFLFSKAGTTRASYISFLTDKGVIFSINEKRAEHLWSKFNFFLPSKLIHNKAVEYIFRFISNYFSHFDLTFLFLIGDEDKLFRTPYTGLFLLSFVPLLFIGFYNLFAKNYSKETKIIILSWLFLSPVASALTRLPPSGNRAFLLIIPLVVIVGVGLVAVFDYFIRERKLKKIIFACLFFFFIFEYLLYLDNYYIHLAIKNAGDDRLAKKELISIIQSLEKNYDQVWLTNKSVTYIHLLFFLKYPPEKYQREANLTPLNEFGFGTVTSFDKYQFRKIPKYFDFSKNILYIASAGEAPENVESLAKTFYPDGRVAYLVFDTALLKKYCYWCSLDFKPADVDIYGTPIKDSSTEE